MVWEGFREEELLEPRLGGGGASQGAGEEGLLKEGTVSEVLCTQVHQREKRGPRWAGTAPQAL